MASGPQRHQFEMALRDELASLVQGGTNHVDRTLIEEVGQRFGIEPEEARDIFTESKGDIWQGEFVESGDAVLGWTAAEVTHVPSAGQSTDDSGIY